MSNNAYGENEEGREKRALLVRATGEPSVAVIDENSWVTPLGDAVEATTDTEVPTIKLNGKLVQNVIHKVLNTLRLEVHAHPDTTFGHLDGIRFTLGHPCMSFDRDKVEHLVTKAIQSIPGLYGKRCFNEESDRVTIILIKDGHGPEVKISIEGNGEVIVSGDNRMNVKAPSSIETTVVFESKRLDKARLKFLVGLLMDGGDVQTTPSGDAIRLKSVNVTEISRRVSEVLQEAEAGTFVGTFYHLGTTNHSTTLLADGVHLFEVIVARDLSISFEMRPAGVADVAAAVRKATLGAAAHIGDIKSGIK